jgi:hypothetical protein
MSVANAKKYAWEAQKTGAHPEDKIENIARALFEIADALESIERKIDRKN